MSVKERLKEQLKKGTTLFYVAFCLYLCKQGISTTMFFYYDYAYNYVFGFYSQWLVIILLSLKIILWDHCTAKQMLYSVLLVSIAAIVSVFSTQMDPIIWGLFVLGARNISAEKILRLYFLITGALTIVAFSASQIGVIPDLVYKSAEGVRHSFGIVYPTDLAAHVFGLVMVWLYLHRGRLRMLHITVILVVTVVLFSLCRTKLDCGMIIFAVILFMCIQKMENNSSVQLYMKYREKREEKKWFLFQGLMYFMFAAFSFLVTVLYNGNNQLLGRFFSTLEARLILGKRGLQEMGVKLLGQYVIMIGGGGRTDSFEGYNFIDCSYLNILIRYGPLFFLAVLLILTIMCYRFRKNWYMSTVLFCWGINAVIAHHLLEITYNPFPLLLLANLGHAKTEQDLPPLPEKICSRLQQWKSVSRRTNPVCEADLIQIIAFLFIVCSNCLPTIMVKEKYDLSRVLWKCLLGDGIGLFLIAGGMKLYHEISYKKIVAQTVRYIVLPMWGIGLFSWFFARWLCENGNFWWSMWHEKEAWGEMFASIFLLKNPFYYMDYTGFIYGYTAAILLFPLWKKILELVKKNKLHRMIVVVCISIASLINDYMNNLFGFDESGWMSLISILMFLIVGFVIEEYRLQYQNKKIKLGWSGLLMLTIFGGINLTRCIVQVRYFYPVKNSAGAMQWFSVFGLISSVCMCMYIIARVKREKTARWKKFFGQRTLVTCMKNAYVIFLMHGMTLAIMTKYEVINQMTEWILMQHDQGYIWEIFYTAVIFGSVFIFFGCIYKGIQWLWKRMETKIML